MGGWCIRGWEPNVGKDALEWILFSTVPVTDAQSAAIILDWYAFRWVIEEYHKSCCFIGRKGDGEPGWQTLWRGWQRLQDLSWGAALAAPG